MAAELTAHELAGVAFNLMAAKLFSLASCVMLFYDIAITFGDEVERIWMRKFSWFTILWFLNRYLSPLGFVVIIVSFHDPSWSKAACNRYVLYPEALKIVTAFVIGVIFITRVYAIYARSLVIVSVGCTLLVIEIAVKIWAFTDGTSLDLPEGLIGCILVGKNPNRFVFTWVAELVFDSAMFFLTMWRTYVHNRSVKGNAASLLNLIFRDGVIYFAVIFAANLVTVLMFLLAPVGHECTSISLSSLLTNADIAGSEGDERELQHVNY
ncbi:hypothetical protein B0H34DRAFT_490961 [Crassisporium funariophilum]|nr:hypothetical protein B0H34DRAFT_490961 [Crassisporium funariophilum]